MLWPHTSGSFTEVNHYCCAANPASVAWLLLLVSSEPLLAPS